MRLVYSFVKENLIIKEEFLRKYDIVPSLNSWPSTGAGKLLQSLLIRPFSGCIKMSSEYTLKLWYFWPDSSVGMSGRNQPSMTSSDPLACPLHSLTLVTSSLTLLASGHYFYWSHCADEYADPIVSHSIKRSHRAPWIHVTDVTKPSSSSVWRNTQTIANGRPQINSYCRSLNILFATSHPARQIPGSGSTLAPLVSFVGVKTMTWRQAGGSGVTSKIRTNQNGWQ